MKTQSTQQQSMIKILGVFGFMLFMMIAFNPIYAQNETSNKTIEGVISDVDGPLPNVNIVLKGTNKGVVTDENGAFVFPTPLKKDDVLVVSYLGYTTEEVAIKEDTQALKLVLTEDQVQIIGALDTGKPYKSKRTE